MRVFFDTSAVIPLVLAEKHSEAVRRAWPDITERWAWSWLVVEAEAALVRQRADADAWAEWSRVLRSLNLVELNPRDHGALLAFNRGLGLRAADAGHLFLFDRLSREVDALQMLTFDREMSQAAKKVAMPLLSVQASAGITPHAHGEQLAEMAGRSSQNRLGLKNDKCIGGYGMELENFHLLTYNQELIDDLLRQVGILTIEEDGTINHTMATLLVDADGRIAYCLVL